MTQSADESVMARFKTVMELFDAGVDLYRQNLRRRFPEADETTIEDYLRAWLLRENEPGDAEGRTVDWPRKQE